MDISIQIEASVLTCNLLVVCTRLYRFCQGLDGDTSYDYPSHPGCDRNRSHLPFPLNLLFPKCSPSSFSSSPTSSSTRYRPRGGDGRRTIRMISTAFSRTGGNRIPSSAVSSSICGTFATENCVLDSSIVSNSTAGGSVNYGHDRQLLTGPTSAAQTASSVSASSSNSIPIHFQTVSHGSDSESRQSPGMPRVHT
jgi:hypothetical protein